MYYILNETNQIIAADDVLLNVCGVKHIDELSSTLIQKSTIFETISDDTIKIVRENDEDTYTVTKTSLSSMLGHLTLVQLTSESITDDADITELNINEDLNDDLNIAFDDDTNDIIGSILNDENDNSLEVAQELNIDLDDDKPSSELELNETDEIMDLLDNTDNDEPISFGDDTLSEDTQPLESLDKTTDNDIETLDDAELFDLAIEDKDSLDIEPSSDNTEILSEVATEDLSLDNIDLFDDTPKKVDVQEIKIDVAQLSHKIGISTEDYNTFLNDFIDTALEVEKDLQSPDIEKQSNATSTLSHLSDVLHIPVVGDIIETISQTNDSEKRELIESLYTAISQITVSNDSTKLPATEEINDEPLLDIEEESLDLFDEPETIEEVPEEIKEKVVNAKSFGTISLEGIKPKHFDFQLDEAANDLSLPVELIEEFVHDFIEQSHIETKKLLEAYEDGDFDTIKKIGHLLKGASSNLRINALSDTLYKIQFCEDPTTLEPLIKDYWAHFLSFENQINVISN